MIDVCQKICKIKTTFLLSCIVIFYYFCMLNHIKELIYEGQIYL
jgi:hypothetical protein